MVQEINCWIGMVCHLILILILFYSGDLSPVRKGLEDSIPCSSIGTVIVITCHYVIYPDVNALMLSV